VFCLELADFYIPFPRTWGRNDKLLCRRLAFSIVDILFDLIKCHLSRYRPCLSQYTGDACDWERSEDCYARAASLMLVTAVRGFCCVRLKLFLISVLCANIDPRMTNACFEQKGHQLEYHTISWTLLCTTSLFLLVYLCGDWEKLSCKNSCLSFSTFYNKKICSNCGLEF